MARRTVNPGRTGMKVPSKTHSLSPDAIPPVSARCFCLEYRNAVSGDDAPLGLTARYRGCTRMGPAPGLRKVSGSNKNDCSIFFDKAVSYFGAERGT